MSDPTYQTTAGPALAPEPQRIHRVGWGFISLYTLALMGTSLLFLAPLLVTLALKINSLVGTERAPNSLALVAGVGSLVAVFSNPFFGRMSDRTSSSWGMRRPWLVIGVLGGFIVGLTSVGSGVFFGLTLLVIFPLRAHKVVGTDIFHAAALLYVAGAAHWAAGNIDFGLLFWLLLGSIPGVLIGGRLTLSIPERFLRLLLGGVLGLAGIKLLDVPGSGVIVVVALSAGVVALLVLIARHSWIRIQRGRNGSAPSSVE